LSVPQGLFWLHNSLFTFVAWSVGFPRPFLLIRGPHTCQVHAPEVGLPIAQFRLNWSENFLSDFHGVFSCIFSPPTLQTRAPSNMIVCLQVLASGHSSFFFRTGFRTPSPLLLLTSNMIPFPFPLLTHLGRSPRGLW